MVLPLKRGQADELSQYLIQLVKAWLFIEYIKLEDIGDGGFLLELEKDVQLFNSSISIWSEYFVLTVH